MNTYNNFLNFFYNAIYTNNTTFHHVVHKKVSKNVEYSWDRLLGTLSKFLNFIENTFLKSGCLCEKGAKNI